MLMSITGFYMYAESSKGKKSDQNMLVSPSKSFTGKGCLTFDYHMRGTHIGSLEVMLRNKDSEHPLFKILGPQGNSWKTLSLELPTVFSRDNYKMRLVFKAVRGGGYTGDIAVDNIRVSNYGCRQIGTFSYGSV